MEVISHAFIVLRVYISKSRSVRQVKICKAGVVVVVVATLHLSCLERKISEKMKIKKLRRGKGRLELPEVIGMGCLG